jgi:Flp pilus assembly protein CpaB
MKRLGLIASVAAALGSVGLGHLYFQRVEGEISGGPKIAVLVAAEDVPVGAALSEKLLAIRDIPQAYVEGRHVPASELKRVLGARLVGGLRANEAVLWSDLAKFSDSARVLSGLVPNGMRAVAIDDRSADFDGLLRPGDRVDVLFSAGGKDDEASSTTTLLQNLLVLSAGGSIARVDEDASAAGARGRGTSVMLSATVEQAQVLTQAKLRGRLILTLRNADDITVVEGVPETTDRDLRVSRARQDMRKADVNSKAIEHVR